MALKERQNQDPMFCTWLADDQPGLYSQLEKVVEGEGIRIEQLLVGLTQGASIGCRIAVREGAISRSKILTLLHEYTYEFLHWKLVAKGQPAKVKECHADAVANEVGNTIRLVPTIFSIGATREQNSTLVWR